MLSKSLTVYRQLLKTARKVDDYNFRSYFVRRVKTSFRSNSGLTGPAADEAITGAVEELKVLNR